VSLSAGFFCFGKLIDLNYRADPDIDPEKLVEGNERSCRSIRIVLQVHVTILGIRKKRIQQITQRLNTPTPYYSNTPLLP
jgi:hypothetical protein